MIAGGKEEGEKERKELNISNFNFWAASALYDHLIALI